MRKLCFLGLCLCLFSVISISVDSPQDLWANKPKVCCKDGKTLQGLNEQMCKAAEGTWVDWDQCN
jgi:hypothetical protein